jgi:hypothetical protein
MKPPKSIEPKLKPNTKLEIEIINKSTILISKINSINIPTKEVEDAYKEAKKLRKTFKIV